MQQDEVAKAQAEEYLAELPEDEFTAFLRRVRPPAAPTTYADTDAPAQQFTSFLQNQLNGEPS